MSLPEGTYAGVSSDPVQEDRPGGASPFTGKVEILTDEGAGLLIVDNGRVDAAYYHDNSGDYRGKDAVVHLQHRSEEAGLSIRYIQYRYSPGQASDAIQICRREGLSLFEEDTHAKKNRSGQDSTMLLSHDCQGNQEFVQSLSSSRGSPSSLSATATLNRSQPWQRIFYGLAGRWQRISAWECPTR